MSVGSRAANWVRAFVNRPRGRGVDELVGDVRYAFRYFARTPLLTLTIVLTLMLGIGTNAALLAVLDGLTNRPAPGVPRDPALVFLTGTMRYGERNRLMERGPSFREIADYRQLKVFKDVAAWTGSSTVVLAAGSDDASVAIAWTDFVTPNYFDVAGIPLMSGSGFMRRTFGGMNEPELTAVISHSLWVDRFGSAPDVVGRRVRVNNREVTIVGVTPPRFNGVGRSSASKKMWMPMSARPLVDGQAIDASRYDRGAHLQTFARLAPGTSIEMAQAAANVVAANAIAQLPVERSHRDMKIEVRPIWRDLGTSMSSADILVGSAVFGSVGLLILLICCTNVSSLLVGAAARRRHEIAVRLSMGAPRRRVVRQLLTEVFMLCLAGGALGLGLYALLVLKVGHMLVDVDVAPDWSSAAGAVAVALGTAIVCGLSPALHATRVQLSSVLKDSAATATSRSRLQRTFVIAQVALTQPLLVGLAVMVVILYGEMESQGRSDAGDRLLRVYYSHSGGSRDQSAVREQRRRLEERIAALPGVEGVVSAGAVMTQISLSLDPSQTTTPTKPFPARLEGVEPRHFAVLGIPVIRGRELTEDDVKATDKPVLVDLEVARTLWGPSADPLGKRLIAPPERGKRSVFVVVGVVDLRNGPVINLYGPTDAAKLFIPNSYPAMGAVIVRTRGPAEAYVGTLRAIGASEQPQLAMTQAKTLSQIERDRITERLTAMGAAAAGGLLALFLGAIGLYAVVALGVAQRTKEIGIRISVGAAPMDVVRMFFNNGLRLGAIGLGVGLPLSIGALWFGASALEVKRASIPYVTGAVMISVLLVAAIASWLPARRAAGVNPLAALRAE